MISPIAGMVQIQNCRNSPTWQRPDLPADFSLENPQIGWKTNLPPFRSIAVVGFFLGWKETMANLRYSTQMSIDLLIMVIFHIVAENDPGLNYPSSWLGMMSSPKEVISFREIMLSFSSFFESFFLAISPLYITVTLW